MKKFFDKAGEWARKLIPDHHSHNSDKTMNDVFRMTLLHGITVLFVAALIHIIGYFITPDLQATLVCSLCILVWVIAYERVFKYLAFNNLAKDLDDVRRKKSVPQENSLRPQTLTFIETGSLMTLILYLAVRSGIFLANLLYGFSDHDGWIWNHPNALPGLAITLAVAAGTVIGAWRLMKGKLLWPFEVKPGASQVLTHDKQTLNAIMKEGLAWLPVWSTIHGSYTQQVGRDEKNMVLRNFTCADGTPIEQLTVSFELTHEIDMLPYASRQGDLSSDKTEMYQFAERLLRALLDSYFSKMNGLRQVFLDLEEGTSVGVLALVPGVTQGGPIDVDAMDSKGVFSTLMRSGYDITQDEKGTWYANIMDGSGKMGLHLTLSNIASKEIDQVKTGNTGIVKKVQEMLTEKQGIQQLSQLPSLEAQLGDLGPLAISKEIGLELPPEASKVLIAGRYANMAQAILPPLLNSAMEALRSGQQGRIDALEAEILKLKGSTTTD